MLKNSGEITEIEEILTEIELYLKNSLLLPPPTKKIKSQLSKLSETREKFFLVVKDHIDSFGKWLQKILIDKILTLETNEERRKFKKTAFAMLTRWVKKLPKANEYDELSKLIVRYSIHLKNFDCEFGAIRGSATPKQAQTFENYMKCTHSSRYTKLAVKAPDVHSIKILIGKLKPIIKGHKKSLEPGFEKKLREEIHSALNGIYQDFRESIFSSKKPKAKKVEDLVTPKESLRLEVDFFISLQTLELKNISFTPSQADPAIPIPLSIWLTENFVLPAQRTQPISIQFRNAAIQKLQAWLSCLPNDQNNVDDPTGLIAQTLKVILVNLEHLQPDGSLKRLITTDEEESDEEIETTSTDTSAPFSFSPPLSNSTLETTPQIAPLARHPSSPFFFGSSTASPISISSLLCAEVPIIAGRYSGPTNICAGTSKQPDDGQIHHSAEEMKSDEEVALERQRTPNYFQRSN